MGEEPKPESKLGALRSLFAAAGGKRGMRRARRSMLAESFTRLLAHKPMRKAMPAEPRDGASLEENQRYEDGMDPFVRFDEALDKWRARCKAARADVVVRYDTHGRWA